MIDENVVVSSPDFVTERRDKGDPPTKVTCVLGKIATTPSGKKEKEGKKAGNQLKGRNPHFIRSSKTQLRPPRAPSLTISSKKNRAQKGEKKPQKRRNWPNQKATSRKKLRGDDVSVKLSQRVGVLHDSAKTPRIKIQSLDKSFKLQVQKGSRGGGRQLLTMRGESLN